MVARKVKADRDVAVELVSASVEETQAMGERLGHLLAAGDVVALFGDLGSGKTTLIQGLARGLGRDPDAIKSPTFVLMREYPGELPLIHIDGYRLGGAPAVSWLDLDVIFSPDKITVIEWAERFADLLPEERIELHLEHVSTNRRRIALMGRGRRGKRILEQLQRESAGGPQQPAVSADPGVEQSYERPGD